MAVLLPQVVVGHLVGGELGAECARVKADHLLHVDHPLHTGSGGVAVLRQEVLEALAHRQLAAGIEYATRKADVVGAERLGQVHVVEVTLAQTLVNEALELAVGDGFGFEVSGQAHSGTFTNESILLDTLLNYACFGLLSGNKVSPLAGVES